MPAPALRTPGGPRLDPFSTFPELVPLRLAVIARDWAAVSAYFGGLGSDEDRVYAAERVADMPGAEQVLGPAVAAHPHDPLPRTLLAYRRVAVAWAIRTGAGSEHVSRAQFTRFHHWLELAETQLVQVCAEHPAYALAWHLRIRTARGLELGAAEARRRYDRLAEHHPHHFPAQAQLLQQLCAKWGGSFAETWNFAQDCVAGAPPGSHSGLLVATAVLEHRLTLSGKEAKGYLRQDWIRVAVTQAAAASVLHPGHRNGFLRLRAHGLFAATLSLGGHHADAAPHFRAMGDDADAHPWDCLDADPGNAFRKHRKTALAKG
ncbi:hypothetical protein ACIQUQ_12330 [Streptomyces sp. NPDC101118]|uniref:hypothetical protein n=1 Tax=Streptomyces sp. NPDC101118 TaxID=3366109 RepID=UPI003822211F